MNAHSSIKLETADSVARDNFGTRWAALQDAGAAVALLAGLAPEPTSTRVRNFPAQVKSTGGWQLSLARQGIEDLDAVMRPGLSALLAVNARGLDATTPALTLWREFHAGRDAVLALCPDTGAMGPRRSA